MEYKVGDCVLLTDLVDPDTAEMGTIKFIEEDNEIKGLYWIYIRANKEDLNINFDNKVGNFYAIVEHISNRLKKLNF